MIDHALSFDGTDDYVLVPDSDSLDLTTGLTVEAWVRAARPSGPMIVAQKWDDLGADWSWVFKYADAGGSQSIELCKDHHNDLADFSVPGPVPSGKWVHVAVTFGTNSTRLYRDGKEVAVRYTPGEIRSSAADLWIGNLYGAWPPGAALHWEPFEGLIDEVRIWDHARTKLDLLLHMHARLTGDEEGLVGYWTFDEGSGQVALDLSGHGNDGQLGESAVADGSDPVRVPRDPGRTITVSPDGTADHLTIQSAVDSAVPGDEVLVHPGEYTETVTVATGELRLRGRDGPAATVVVGADGSLPVISSSGDGLVVEGLGIRGGAVGIRLAECAGGIVRDCEVTESAGPGVHADEAAHLEVRGSTIARNAGTGILHSLTTASPDEGVLVVDRCDIRANGGRGIFAALGDETAPDTATVVVRGCRITRNDGDGVRIDGPDETAAVVERCLLAENAGAGVAAVAPPPLPFPQSYEVRDSVIRSNVGPGVCGDLHTIGCLVEGNASGAVCWTMGNASWRSVSDSLLVGNRTATDVVLCAPEVYEPYVSRTAILGNTAEGRLFSAPGVGRCCDFEWGPVFPSGAFERVTAAHNQSGGFRYGGGYCAFMVQHCIVWGHPAPAYLYHFAMDEFPDCFAEGCSAGSNCGEESEPPGWVDVTEDPRFLRPGVFDFDRFRTVIIRGVSHPVPDFVVHRGDYRVEPESPASGMGALGVRGDLPPEGLPGRVLPCRYPYAAIVDGRLDDDAWEDAPWHGPTLRLERPTGSADAGFEIALVADARWLYVAARISDDEVVHDEAEPPSLWSDDSIELFLDPDDARGGQYAPDDVQITIGAATIGRDPLAPVLGGVGGGPESGTRATARRTDDGWTVEAAIPLRLDGRWHIETASGSRIGFEVHLNDDDDGGERDSVLVWSRWDFDEAWERPGAFGEVEFVRVDGAPASEPEVEALPDAVDFGMVDVGEVARASVTLRNDGSAMLDVAGATLAEGASAEISIDVAPPASWLAPGQEIVVELVCEPTSEGPVSATVVVQTDDADEPRLEIPVAGSGVWPSSFIRADTDDNGGVDISDAIRALVFLFRGGVAVSCADALDANDDGEMDIADPVYTLNFLFLGAAPPPPPFPACGPDPTKDELGDSRSTYCDTLP